MSRTIADLAAGTIVYVDETVSGDTVHVPYIYLGKNDNNDCILLREKALGGKRMNATNVASYAGCEMDVWLENSNDGFLARFDSATLNALQNTSIKYVDYNQSGDGTAQVLQISRKCFLLSYSEEGYGNDAAGNEGSSFLDALKTYYDTTNANTARITYAENGTAVYAWMRSAVSTSGFRSVYTNGSGSGSGASYAGYCPRPALSVASATIVSDEGADYIFLLPDGRRTTWDVQATMKIGESADLPLRGRADVEKSSISSCTIQLCNNYGDTTPVWETCDANGDVTFANTTKETTNWEIGVKITAASSTPSSYIGEPIVTISVETEE